MSRRSRPALALVVAAALAACGDAEAPPATSPATLAEAEPIVAVRAAAPAAALLDAAAIDALFRTYRGGGEHAERIRAADALVAAGRPALDQLLPKLGGEEDSFLLRELIVRFGAAAVGPLVELLRGDDEDRRAIALHLLRDSTAAWAFSREGDSVCRALADHLAIDRRAAALALGAGRPAAAVAARELATAWRTHGGDWLAGALVGLGPDGAAARDLVLDIVASPPDPRLAADPDRLAALRGEAWEILAAIAPGDPGLLATVRELAAGADEETRAGAIGFLATYGDGAAAAAAELSAALRGDGAPADAACETLRRLPDLARRLWRDIAASDSGSELLRTLLFDPAFAAHAAAEATSLGPGAAVRVVEALPDGNRFDARPLCEALLANPSAEVRLAALDRLWFESPTPGAADPPERAPAYLGPLLDDPDPLVRLHAAGWLACCADAPSQRIAAVREALTSSADDEVRDEALRALGRDEEPAPHTRTLDDLLAASADTDSRTRRDGVTALGARFQEEVRAIAALLRAAGDEDWDVRRAALDALSRGDGRLPSLPDASLGRVVSTAISECADRSGESTALAVLRRCEGGLAALLRTIESAIEEGDAPRSLDLRTAARAVVRLGPDAAPVRGALVRAAARSPEDAGVIDDALRAIDQTPPDAVALARQGRTDEESVRALLAFGEAGRRALALLAGHASSDRVPELLPRLAGVRVADVVADAARATGPGAGWLQRGAIALAPLLPDADAVAALAPLVREDDRSIADEALDALVAIQARAPAAVPDALVADLLRGAGGRRDWKCLRLVGTRGPRIAALDPSLVAELRRIRDDADETSGERAGAAAWLWTITRDQQESLPTLRGVLLHPERTGDLESPPGWRKIGEVLAEMRLGPEDVAAITTALQDASQLMPYDRKYVEHDPRGDSRAAALFALVPLAGRLGAAAAPAVPALRVTLGRWSGEDRWYSVEDGPDTLVVRALGAIGAPARDAIPDLRRWAAAWGDPQRAARDAVARIEAACAAAAPPR